MKASQDEPLVDYISLYGLISKQERADMMQTIVNLH